MSTFTISDSIDALRSASDALSNGYMPVDRVIHVAQQVRIIVDCLISQYGQELFTNDEERLITNTARLAADSIMNIVHDDRNEDQYQ